MKRWMCLIGLLLFGEVAYADFNVFDNVTFQNAAAATGNGTVVAVDRFSTVGLYTAFTGTAEVTFEVTSDGANWVSTTCTSSSDTAGELVTSTTASGAYQCNVAGHKLFRVRVSAWTSGTVTVTGRATTAILGRRGGGGGGSQGLSSVLAIDRIDGDAVDEASAFASGSGAADAYWVWFYDLSEGLIFTCKVSGVLDDCHKGVKLLDNKFYRIKNQANTVVWEIDHTGALTEGSINVETAGVTLTTTEENWWDVASCQNTTANLVWNVPTANSPAAACDTGSNTQKGYASFDASTDESFQMDWVLPTGWTGAIDVHFIWKAAATSGAVGWCAQLIRVADASTSDPAFPAQASGNCVSDTAKGTTLQENHATISGVTCTSCAARDHVYVRISRDANGGAVTDDMTGDAHLMKVGRTWRVAK